MSIFNSSYFIIQPGGSGSFISEWENCFSQLIEISKDTGIRIFKINFFIHTTSNKDYQKKKIFIGDAILNTFGEECPTFGISSNSPESNYKVAAEIGMIKASDFQISYRTWKDRRYTVIEKNGYKELWANGIESKISAENISSSSEIAFDILFKILESEGMTFDNIVRQWNYIGKILKFFRKNSLKTQHYQVFNKTRSEYYGKYRSLRDFPAATGIGMKYGMVMIDICAVSGSKGLEIKSLSNPRQINPYNYDQRVLIGAQGKEQKQPPLFERAKLLIFSKTRYLFVSGTASILGQETTGIDNIENQTIITIENISKLVSDENLSLHYPGIKFTKPLQFSRVRVYVKNEADIPSVKSICSKHYGKIPLIFIQADICRTNLLVEIEADLSCRAINYLYFL